MLIDRQAHTKRNQVAAALTSLDAALDQRDGSTYGHSHRVASYAVMLGRLLRLTKCELVTIERAAFLHDIGKIHVPDRILKKAGPLTESEWKIMRSHVVTGYAMLSAVPGLAEVATIVLAHHERYDGRGYPHRLEAEEISLGARICAVADCLDALTAADRTYRTAISFPEACHHVVSQRRGAFDPVVVDAFQRLSPSEWRAFHVSLAYRTVRRVEWDALQWPFDDGGEYFDKVSQKVIACAGAAPSVKARQEDDRTVRRNPHHS